MVFKDQCHDPEMWGSHSLKCYGPNYLLHENRTLYHQHTQIITEVYVKPNKWHITIEKLCRKRTETEQIFFLNTDLKRSRRKLSHCVSRQLGEVV